MAVELTSGVSFSGPLFCKVGFFSTWKECQCELEHQVIRIFDSDGSVLESIQFKLAVSAGHYPIQGGPTAFGFAICSQNAVWSFCAPDAESRAEWLLRIGKRLGRHALPFHVRVEGWLRKQGGIVRNWKTRWFVVGYDSILYFESPSTAKSWLPLFGAVFAYMPESLLDDSNITLGSINLKNASVCVLPQYDGKTDILAIKATERTYFVQGKDLAEIELIMQHIKEAIDSANSPRPLSEADLAFLSSARLEAEQRAEDEARLRREAESERKRAEEEKDRAKLQLQREQEQARLEAERLRREAEAERQRLEAEKQHALAECVRMESEIQRRQATLQEKRDALEQLHLCLLLEANEAASVFSSRPKFAAIIHQDRLFLLPPTSDYFFTVVNSISSNSSSSSSASSSSSSSSGERRGSLTIASAPIKFQPPAREPDMVFVRMELKRAADVKFSLFAAGSAQPHKFRTQDVADAQRLSRYVVDLAGAREQCHVAEEHVAEASQILTVMQAHIDAGQCKQALEMSPLPKPDPAELIALTRQQSVPPPAAGAAEDERKGGSEQDEKSSSSSSAGTEPTLEPAADPTEPKATYDLSNPATWPNRPILFRRTPNTEAEKTHSPPPAIVLNEPKWRCLPIDTDLFEGRFFAVVRDLPGETKAVKTFFKSKQRSFQIMIQGRFKRPIPYQQLQTGQFFDEPLPADPPWWLTSTMIPAMRLMSPGLKVDLESARPYMLSPLVSTMQTIHIAPSAVQAPDVLSTFGKLSEDMSLLSPELRKMQSGDRKSFFSDEENLRKFTFDPSHVYTFEYFQHLIHLNSFLVKYSYFEFDLIKFLGKSPFRFMAVLWSPESDSNSGARPSIPVQDDAGKKMSNARSYAWCLEFFHENSLKA